MNIDTTHKRKHIAPLRHLYKHHISNLEYNKQTNLMEYVRYKNIYCWQFSMITNTFRTYYFFSSTREHSYCTQTKTLFERKQYSNINTPPRKIINRIFGISKNNNLSFVKEE